MDTARRRLLGSIQDFHGLTWAALGFAAVVCAQTTARYFSETTYFSAFRPVTVERSALTWIKDVRFSISKPESENAAGEKSFAQTQLEIIPVKTIEITSKITRKKPGKKSRLISKAKQALKEEQLFQRIQIAQEANEARLEVLNQIAAQLETFAETEMFVSARELFGQLRGQFIEAVRSDFNPIRVAAYHLNTAVKTTAIEPMRAQTLSDVITTTRAGETVAERDEYSSQSNSNNKTVVVRNAAKKSRDSQQRAVTKPKAQVEYSPAIEKNPEKNIKGIMVVSLNSQIASAPAIVANKTTIGQVLAPTSVLNSQNPPSLPRASLTQTLTKQSNIESQQLVDEEKASNSIQRRRYVEAFKENEEIGFTETIEIERSNEGAQSGWIVTKAEGHLPTVSWMSSQKDYQMNIPLFSQITFDLLRKHPSFKMNIQSGTGVIFGKISAGELIDANVRPDQLVYLNQDLKVLRPEELTEERNFVIFNVLPGAAVLRVQSLAGSRGGVPVLVEKDAATYIDVRAKHWSRETLRGRVLDAGSSKPVVNAEVAVIDQKKSTSVTDHHGNYLMASIDRLADMPYFVEVRAGTQYPHRYRQAKSTTNERMLFLFNEEKINDWVSQLEGGVSAESGIIAGALRRPAEKFQAANPTVTIRPLAENTNLVPEAYLLNRNGELEAKASLSRTQYQLVGVQVPAGPARVSVDASISSPDSTWSEVTVVSPGVVSVVESY